MVKYDGGDKDFYPASKVLINKLGIRDQTELDEAEAAFVLLATVDLAQTPLPEPDAGPGFEYLLAIHRALFSDIYPWAGEIRDVDITKGQTRFANCHFIEPEGKRLTDQLAAEAWLNGSAVEAFAARMAYYLGELNVLHPFREGNGRTLREYVRYLAERAGHTLSWDGVTSTEMIEASIASYHGNYRPLTDLLLRQLSSRLTDDD